MARLYRFAASIIFATREGYCYPIAKWSVNDKPALSQRQRLAQLYPHVIQKSDHVRGIDILFVQRTTEAGFMPDSYVFPGGVLDDADCSQEWLELFPADTKQSMMNRLMQKTPNNRLPLYSNISTNSIAGELAFRICAIREAFEETGILLARPLSQLKNGTQSPCYQSSQSLLDEWRGRVCDDATNFVRLFREIKCVPDVWSLVEWSNWLTPENMPRRYDTVFYLCCLDGMPTPMFNPSEVTKAQWMSADQALHDHSGQHITLPPPQITELSLINMFPSIQHLHLYGLYKSLYDSRTCLLVMRILMKFTSGEDSILYSLLPGDDLYPVETSLNRYQCSSEALRHSVTFIKSDHALYEFTATAPSSSDLVTNKMLRLLFSNTTSDVSYVDTVRMQETNNIISDINTIMNSKL